MLSSIIKVSLRPSLLRSRLLHRVRFVRITEILILPPPAPVNADCQLLAKFSRSLLVVRM
jgi:hypothetical protein